MLVRSMLYVRNHKRDPSWKMSGSLALELQGEYQRVRSGLKWEMSGHKRACRRGTCTGILLSEQHPSDGRRYAV